MSAPKLLLTSGGVRNPSIRNTLTGMLDKPIAESTALCVPTANYGMSRGRGFNLAHGFISGTQSECPMTELGWKSVGVLELSVLPSIGEENWVPAVRDADVLLVNGGDPMFLHHWMRESGLADLLPSLTDTVYVGLSAGSMIMTPGIGEDFVNWRPPTGGDETLGLVDFSIFPHLDHPAMPENTMADATKWAATMPRRCYAIDDDTAIAVTDGDVHVVSEGNWKLFPSAAAGG